MKKAFFLTGTDTGVGKTFTSCTMLRAWRDAGLTVTGYKPVASGAEIVDGVLCNEDALALQQSGSPGFSLQDINPVCLREAIAPHLAAKTDGVRLTLAGFRQGFDALSRRADCVLVEGAGGFRVPLGEDFDSADVAQSLGLPIILVVGLRLGCINHALLSIEAIHARGLTLAGWVGNTLRPEMDRLQENIATLKTMIPEPCLGVLPDIADHDPAKAVGFLTVL
jgi:dethiobiotin synthetase